MTRRTLGLALVLVAVLAPAGVAADPVPDRPVRFMLHGNMSHEPPTEEYLRFVEKVRPDVLIMGVFDQRLYALAAPPSDRRTKTPAPADLLARWKEVADRLHRSGIRLIGQMEMNVVSDRPADREQGTGWFGFYDKGWDEKRLGRRPTSTAAELLEEPDLDASPKPGPASADEDTRARCGCRVNTKALRACINKPAWREVHKQMVRAAVAIGVDGFMTNRNFFGHCACADCRRKFRQWLSERYSPEELRSRFGIARLDQHPLTCVVGAHRELETVPDELVLEKQRFAKHMVKEFFDEVYVRYARNLRSDLFAAQWNHMANFDELHLDRGHLPPATRTTFAHGAADERWSLPAGLWAKDESLVWYCNWGTTQNTILDKEYAGDTVLYGKYVRAMAGGKPYVVNKYDYYRPRNMMAEAAALGYATNALATPWQTEADRAVMLRYFDFLRKHDALYRPTESYAEIGLAFPRRALHAGDASPLEYVESAARALIRQHVLFDLLPDDLLATTPLKRYRAIVLSGTEFLLKAETDLLARYVAGGGRLLVLPVAPEDRDRPGAASAAARRQLVLQKPFALPAVTVPNARTDREAVVRAVEGAAGAGRLSRFEMPWTVEVHAYRQAAAKRLVLHFVNYNHREKMPGKSVVENEAPVAAKPVVVRLQLPEQFEARSVRFLSPDADGELDVKFAQRAGVLEFQTPGFLVYGVCVITD